MANDANAQAADLFAGCGGVFKAIAMAHAHLETLRDGLLDEFVAKVRGINAETKGTLYRVEQCQHAIRELERARAALMFFQPVKDALMAMTPAKPPQSGAEVQP